MTYEETEPFAHAIAMLLEKQYPEEVVSKMTKKLRKGKVFVDWSQNNRHKTTVAVYSLRAKERPDGLDAARVGGGRACSEEEERRLTRRSRPTRS